MGMKKLILLTPLLLLCCNFANAQPGFSKEYVFEKSTSFHNLLLNEDTLIITGTAFDSIAGKWGALFVKMDTVGNVLDYRLQLDPDGDEYVFSNKSALIRTNDGGYARNGYLWSANATILIKLDVEGEIELVRKYFDDTVFTTFQWGLIELSDGYLISGTKNRFNGHNDVYAMKVDKEGNEIWEKLYGEYGISENLGKCVQVDDNTFVIGAHKGIGTPSPYDSTTTWCRSWIFAIDSLGNVKWEFQAEKYEDCAVWELAPTPDGGWIYPTSRAEIIPEYFNNVFGYTCKVVRRDSNLNEVWSKELSPTSWEVNYLSSIAATPDGGWVAAGRWVLPTTPTAFGTEYNWIAGCIYKLSADGDSIWSRCDTVAMPYQTFEHYYNGMVVLPSGSVVLAGKFLGDGKSHGWLVKVDKDGCLEELCKVSGVEDLDISDKRNDFIVYPNPANDFIKVLNPMNKTHIPEARFKLYDLTGKLINESVTLDNSEHIVSVSGLAQGIYFYTITINGELIKSGKLGIVR
jgi:Secretion system C-terminal sorting domain